MKLPLALRMVPVLAYFVEFLWFSDERRTLRALA
jgi:hypothetical protein